MTVAVSTLQKVIVMVGFLLLTGLTGLSEQHPRPKPSEVLRALREKDAACLRSYSITMRVEEAVRFPDWRRAVYRLRGTSSPSQTVAIILDHKEVLKYPSYSALRKAEERWGDLKPIPPIGIAPASVSLDEWVKMVYLQEGRRYLEADWRQLLWLSPSGEVVSVITGSGPSIEILRSSCSLVYGRLLSGIKALGRGFSEELGEALSVRILSGRLLELKARDKYNPSTVWRLIVDPSRQYLVVEAEEVASSGRVCLRYKSEGAIDSAIPLAKRGSETLFGDIVAGDWTWHFECESYEARFREDWYDQVKQVFRCPPKGSSVLDYRTEPFSSFTVK